MFRILLLKLPDHQLMIVILQAFIARVTRWVTQ